MPNVWNAKNALLFQEKEFPAIATSSAAVANSLDYEDGERMPFNDYLFVIKRILALVQVPVSVLFDKPYSNITEFSQAIISGRNFSPILS